MNSMLMRGLMIGLTALSGSLALSAQVVVSSGFEQLDRWASECLAERSMTLGYPGNNDIRLEEFYRWYTGNNLESMIINNAGDPFEEGDHTLSSLDFEREVIQYFAPKYGFDGNDLWGIVTMSGTDGNNHGIYFGVNYLKRKTGKMPVVYVSDEAHYSNYRLCDLQHLEVRLVKSDSMGRMVPDSLEKVLDPTRPCLIVYAMGSTFKGAIDDQKALDDVLASTRGWLYIVMLMRLCSVAICHSPNIRTWLTAGKPALIPLASAVINSSASTALADSSSQPATFTTISQPTTSLI